MIKDYQIVVGTEYYVIFTDGNGKRQKEKVSKEVADAIIEDQRYESALIRQNERNRISLESLDYEGEVFAIHDQYGCESNKGDMTLVEKVRIVISQMKPEQANLLIKLCYGQKTQEEIAKETGTSQAAVSQRFQTAKKSFEKIFEEIFGKTL